MTAVAASAGFAEHLDRRGTHSAKWDLLAAPLGPGAVSMSVADMEFRTAPCVIDAVVAAARHGTYGYTEVFDDFRGGRPSPGSGSGTTGTPGPRASASSRESFSA